MDQFWLGWVSGVLGTLLGFWLAQRRSARKQKEASTLDGPDYGGALYASVWDERNSVYRGREGEPPHAPVELTSGDYDLTGMTFKEPIDNPILPERGSHWVKIIGKEAPKWEIERDLSEERTEDI